MTLGWIASQWFQSHYMVAFHLSDNGSGVRVTYGFLRPHVKSEEFKGLDSTSLVLLVFREEKPDRNHYDRTAPSGQEVGGKVWQTREHSAEPKGDKNR